MKKLNFFLLAIIFTSFAGEAQRRKTQSANVASNALSSELFNNFKFRNIGPAFMSGRVADLAIHPEDESIWYVAIASGGVWKTENAGVTFAPIFDKEVSYSTGCVTIDPNNPNVVWVGTGENDGGRHIGYGDGIYKSEDGGASWKNMGLKKSEHISKIDIHPDNSDVIRVASQGPLWSAGGERGFYISTDGGQSWKKTLGDDEYTGVTDFAVDPGNPDWIYAATWQHHRTVATLMGGGPKTKIYRSSDGGNTWKELSNGLPEGNMGKIGLAISPINPDVVYAAIELNRTTGGVFRSDNRGGSWTKMSDQVAGATGPHYYQEVYASPHKFDRIYLMDSPLQMSDDGGKTFVQVNTMDKHVDNHAMAFKKSDPDYIMVGTDGGVYESFDLGANWRYMENIPVTQFYKVAIDDAEPFYNIYGGTQDNSTQGGPSRTDNLSGIRNADWSVILNWDGHQPATEPGNPNIVYAERQQGNLSRIDMTTGEATDIQPQPDAGEPYERFNWDAPILVSPHSPARLYFASQRVWKSDNRGNSWTAISGDLTKNEERIGLSIMGRKQSWDSPWDVGAMSMYNTITSLAESPLKEGLIYAGTDDGILQVTDNGGETWKKINVSSMAGVPATSFINDVKADLYDENTVYVVLDNHKYGDYKPYLVKSTDKGVSWSSMTNGLTERNLVWRIVQDHISPNLMFLATELGIYLSIDGGNNWTEMKGGIPPISFRDLAIQNRENDLVAASFGRGFFILDDYSALREISNATLNKEAELYTPRKAWWYIPRSIVDFDDKKGSQGSQLYLAPNPDFGAVFTYFMKEDLKSMADLRKEKERTSNEQYKDVPFPGWDSLEKETIEKKPTAFIEIKNESGVVVNRVSVAGKKGFNRAAWNLRVASNDALSLNNNGGNGSGLLAAPGTYTGQLFKVVQGKVSSLADPVTFEVVPLRPGALPGSSPEVAAEFWRSYESINRDVNSFDLDLQNMMKAASKLHLAATRSSVGNDVIEKALNLESRVRKLQVVYQGNPAKLQIGERTNPTIGSRMFAIWRGLAWSTYGPTETHKKSLKLVLDELTRYKDQLAGISTEISNVAVQIVEAGGPVIEGQN